MATKYQMVKEIFLDATRGKLTPGDLDAWWLVETIADKLDKKSIASIYDDLRECYLDAEGALSRLVDFAYMESTGANGMTETCKRILQTYHRFF